uniref:Nudix hydrolase domain-containing protein n=1 Tax=Panagrolaimus sp. JU765 TaxID=591449 RepID=A0AC34QGM9_9BILA
MSDELACHLETALQGCKIEEIRYENLLKNHDKNIAGTAAVLVLLDFRDGEWYVLLTVRSKKLRRHPGEVCFPGGMREHEDVTCVATALRESYEEIGLPSTAVRIIASLKPCMSRHLVILYPVVGLLVNNFTPFCSEEVDKVFYSPLKSFLEAKSHTAFYFHETFQIHAFMLEEHVFGLTAFLSIMVAMAVLDRYPEFQMDVIKDKCRPARALVAEIASKASKIATELLPSERESANKL